VTERGMKEVMVGQGLLSFGQKARGMTERGIKEVVARPLWQLLWPSEKGSFGWFWERKSKARGRRLVVFFFFVEIGKILGLSLCLFFKKFHSSVN